MISFSILGMSVHESEQGTQGFRRLQWNGASMYLSQALPVCHLDQGSLTDGPLEPKGQVLATWVLVVWVLVVCVNWSSADEAVLP